MRRGLIAAVAVVAAATPSPAQAARAWDPPQVARSGDGVDMVDPRSAYTARGELVAAWSRTIGDSVSAGSSATSPLRVAVRGRDAQRFGPARTMDPDASSLIVVVADGAGGTRVAWIDDQEILKAAYRPPGGSFGSEQAIDYATALDVATNDAGASTLAYRTPFSGIRLVSAPPGEAFSGVVAAGPAARGAEPDVGVFPDGHAVVVWQHEDYRDGSLTARAAMKYGGEVTEPMQLSRPGWSGHRPQVAVGRGGHAMATWSEGTRPFASGPVMTARLSGCCFTAPVPANVTSTWRGTGIVPLEGTAALLAPFSIDAWMAKSRMAPNGPTVVGADMAGGTLTPPQRIGTSGGFLATANAAGVAALTQTHASLTVARREPGAGFGPEVAVVCDRPARLGSAAVAPDGRTSVFFTQGSNPFAPEPAQLVEDHPSATAGPGCAPPAKRRRVTRGSLMLQARMPRGGKLLRGRWLQFRVSCGTACRIRAGGAVRLRGRRRPVPLSTGTGRRLRAGTTTVRVGLTRTRARRVRRALARRRVVRARLTVRASGGTQSRALVFRVRLRR